MNKRKIPSTNDRIDYQLELLNSYFKGKDIEFIKEIGANGLSLCRRTKEQKKQALSSDVYFGAVFTNKKFLEMLTIVNEILHLKDKN